MKREVRHTRASLLGLETNWLRCFPLTPARYLGERENGPLVVRQAG